MLKPSAMTSTFHRSLIAMRRAIRRSIWKNPGRAKAFRPRVPVQPQNGRVFGKEKLAPLPSTQRSGGVKANPLMKGDTVEPAGGEDVLTKEGRPLAEPKSRLES